MKQLLYILFFWQVAVLAGCSELHADLLPADRPVTVEMVVRPDRMALVTRTADETSIRDVNLYLYDASGNRVLHSYSTAPTLRFECLPGTYRLYVAANLGYDSGAAADPRGLRLDHADDFEVLPMIYEGETVISAVTDPMILPTIEVRRAVAKVTYEVSAQPDDMELVSVQVCSVARHIRPFAAEAAPSDDPADYMDCPAVRHFGRTASGSCYLLPNLQGANPVIVEPGQKNCDNAPAHASYLLIRTLRGTRVLTYRVYLGRNTTSNFDVAANTHYTLGITIRGDQSVDTRVSSYEAVVYDDCEAAAYGGYCSGTVDRRLHLEVASEGELPPLRAEVRIVEGDAAALRLDGQPLTAPFVADLEEGSNDFALDYAPALFDASNRNLVYTVHVADAYGFERTTRLAHTFANSLEANVWSRAISNGEGSIRISGHLYSREVSAATHNRLVLCDEGCTLRAEPAVGCTFAGWYADERFQELVAATPEYHYVARARHGVLYARFKLIDGAPLDISGTANCYLAPQLGTWYSFNATTRGNGKQTPGLSAAPLQGAEAHVLWESGTTPGAVLQDAFYRRGRLYVRTGTTQGNAVVGLFNAAGACIWSWHIWSTDYDPAAAAQQVDGGAVFMDRNLGALGDHRIRVEGKGLYYQWGRKDPFPHPAAHGSGIPASVCAREGYAFGVHDTDESFALSDFSVAWSVAHPTTFLHHIGLDRWCYAFESALWHTPDVSGSGKTAYDPCPPGWRVPRSSAWAVDKMYRVYTVSGCGEGIRHRPNIAQTIDYPYTGTLENRLQTLHFSRTDADVELWCAEVETSGTTKAQRLDIIGGKASISGASHASAHPVRCVKE